MDRSIADVLKRDLGKKILMISGPRQVGKTTVARSLHHEFVYLNFDITAHRKSILRESWNHSPPVIVFDEIHKMKNWKRWLKGIHDAQNGQAIVVTGSVKLDTFKKTGDSLAGRFYPFSLFPLDPKELAQLGIGSEKRNLELLLKVSGFPEPFLAGTESFYRRWRQTHLDIIIKQDLIETESIKRLGDLATVVELMTERVGSTFSYNSLREDLQTDDKTIKRWMLALENSFVLFKIPPYSKSIKGALQKAPKYYFFDVPRVVNEGPRLENLVALSLYKEIQTKNDLEGAGLSLHYLRNKQKMEVDFLICKDKIPIQMIEVKLTDPSPSDSFAVFEKLMQPQRPLRKIQVVKNLDKPFKTKDSIEVISASSYLAGLDLK